jgi:hypothetical protein
MDLAVAEKAEKQIGGEGGEANMNSNEINGLEAEKQLAEKPYNPLGVYKGERGASPLPEGSGGDSAPEATAGLKRLVGGRWMHRHEGEEEIGQQAEWLLVRCPHWSRDGWHSLKLYRDRKGRKRCWYVGVKDGRMAKNGDASLLLEHHADRVEWVIAQVDRYVAAQ